MTVHPDDTIHTAVGQLRAHIAGVTSLDDVIERQLHSTAQVYQHLDEVMPVAYLECAKGGLGDGSPPVGSRGKAPVGGLWDTLYCY